jgi:putative pyruvate formate lyase activating enzyme
MPDFKFWDNHWSDVYCHAPDYPEIARAAIKEMHRQVGDLVVDDRGIAERGLLLRHLVMPENVAGTSGVMNFIAAHISPNTYVNIMDQYHPSHTATTDPKIGRRILAAEYSSAIEAAQTAGIARLDGNNRHS